MLLLTVSDAISRRVENGPGNRCFRKEWCVDHARDHRYNRTDGAPAAGPSVASDVRQGGMTGGGEDRVVAEVAVGPDDGAGRRLLGLGLVTASVVVTGALVAWGLVVASDAWHPLVLVLLTWVLLFAVVTGRLLWIAGGWLRRRASAVAVVRRARAALPPGPPARGSGSTVGREGGI